MDSRRLIVDDSGSEVARLHARPRTSDLTVPGDEVSWMFVAPAVRDAASKYEAEYVLAPTAIIGERRRWLSSTSCRCRRKTNRRRGRRCAVRSDGNELIPESASQPVRRPFRRQRR